MKTFRTERLDCAGKRTIRLGLACVQVVPNAGTGATGQDGQRGISAMWHAERWHGLVPLDRLNGSSVVLRCNSQSRVTPVRCKRAGRSFCRPCPAICRRVACSRHRLSISQMGDSRPAADTTAGRFSVRRTPCRCRTSPSQAGAQSKLIPRRHTAARNASSTSLLRGDPAAPNLPAPLGRW